MEHLIMSSSFQKQLKNFVLVTKQYSHCHDESSKNAVLCSLQILGQPSNQFVFDSKSTLIQEFYINLYELMNNSNDESDLMWASINVLQSTLKQGFSFNSIVNNYKFILILTKLLKEQYPMDKKIIVLKLLQDLTYGVKLEWQESYLSELIILLVKWISSDEKDLVSFSLGVLVNVCCKNKFAMFTLVKCTHSKSFMRLLLKLQSDNLFNKVQVYKLLLVLEHVSGQVPHVDVNNLIDVTFVVLEEGLKLKNVFVLHHAIDFFIDICEHSHWKNSVLNYSNYQPKLTNLLDVMNNYKHVEKLHSHHDITLQSIGLVLQFIHHVIKLKNESFNALYPNLINQTLHWAQFENLHQQAMLIFQTIIINLRINNSSIDQNLQRDIYEQLEESLDVLFAFLFEYNSKFVNESSTSTWNRYALCFSILQEMLKHRNLYKKIEEKLNISFLQTMILGDVKDLNNLQNFSPVCIETLYFLSDLVAKNPKWMSLYSEVLNQKHVYNTLAHVIYNGSKMMKQKVLDLITKFSQQSTLMLCEAMEEIKQCSLKQIKDTTDLNLNEIEMKPLCSFAQEEQLQVFIDKLDNMFNSNKIEDIKTSNVIQLYQCKLNVSKQTEVWLKKSLDNAYEEITNLNYRMMSLNNESVTLNKMLLENHMNIDELTIENNELKKKVDYITEQFSTTSNEFAKLTQNYESKRQIILEQNATIKTIEKQFTDLNLESNKMKENLLEQIQNEKNEKSQIIQERDETVQRFEKQVAEINEESRKLKENLLDQMQNEKTEYKKHISKLEQQIFDKQSIISEKIEEIDSKTLFIKNMENCILEKDKDITDLRKQLEEQHRVREMISQMLAATSSKPKFSDD